MPAHLAPGDTAPPLLSQAVRRGEIVDLTLDEALKGADYLVLVFYPADFTFVCPTEIVQFTEKFSEFAAQSCNIVCCSTDSVYTHLAWLKAPKAERGLGAGSNAESIVLLSDRSHEISRAYGVLAASGAAYRGTFLIDRNKTICQVTINDMPVGRSVDDALRMLTELRNGLAAQGGGPVESPTASHAVTGVSAGSQLQQPQKQQSNSSNTNFNLTGSDQQKEQFRSSRLQDPVHYLQRKQQQQSKQRSLPRSRATASAVCRAVRPARESSREHLQLRDSEVRLARLLAEAGQARVDTQRLRAVVRERWEESDRLAADDNRAVGIGQNRIS
uniref:thioredoxin-dependent peroxiredoxin n=1 Tax=Macrostomum lignano TaxID=282301 RepID=A0A1I8GTH4_9PLAT